MTTFAQSFEDGIYKIHWAWNGRGYMVFHADYPTEAKLADVTLNGYQNSHFSTTAEEPMSLYWYLITGADSKQYLFNADTGLFLNVSDVAADAAKANLLSETADTPIEIVTNTSADYTLYGTYNGVRYFLSSGCGQPSKTGHPVRWSTNTGDLSDGGTPLQLIPVTDVTIDPTILAVAKEAVGFTAVEPEPEPEPEVPAVKWYRLKESTRSEYMNVASFDPAYEQGAYGMVNIAPYAESDAQIFTMEDAGDGKVYLRTKNDYYVTCGAWNVNVSPSAKEALIFEETSVDGATAYYIHASSQASKGFKIGGVSDGNGGFSQDYYVYCDAPQDLWAKWILEEVAAEPAPDVNEPDAEILAKVDALLALNGVGYPKQSRRIMLQDVLETYKNDVNEANYNALRDSIDSYYASTEITLPTAGKYYSITAVAPNGKDLYFDYNGTELTLVERTEATELPLSALFKFENYGPNKFRIWANDSTYLVYSHGEGSNISWMTENTASKTGVQNVSDTLAVEEMGQITFSKILKGGNVSANNDALFGLMQWNSMRGIRTENSEYVNGCLVINASTGDFDASDAPFYKQNTNGNYYTSALRIEDAVFPALTVSEPVTIDLINDTWTPALRDTWYSAEYLTKEYNNGAYTIKITDNNSCYIENGAFRLAGNGSKITLPAFDFNVEKIEVVRHGKVRRAKLFYLRDRVGKAAKVKEKI